MSILGRRWSNVLFNLSIACEQVVPKLHFTSVMYGKSKSVGNQNVRVVDLRSDTLSKPSLAMRQAMFDAEVGDDVFGEDPTVNALEKRAAEMLGKEASLFVASGTMGNLIAIMAHCDRRGCNIISGDKSHIVLYEQFGAAQIGGVQIQTVKNNPDGTFSIDEMKSKIRDSCNVHYSRTALICVENTQNVCGGKVLPMSWVKQLVAASQELKIPLHIDGARVFNAAVASGMSIKDLVKDFASVSVCLSKSLGAPVGSVLVGSSELIEKGRRLRKVLGGGMRQAGVIAAAGLYSLNNMVDRLADDNARTKAIAKAVAETNSKLFTVDLENIHSNILFIKVDKSRVSMNDFSNRLYKITDDEKALFGDDKTCIIKVMPLDDESVRVVLYCDITQEDVDIAINKLKFVIKEFDSKV